MHHNSTGVDMSQILYFCDKFAGNLQSTESSSMKCVASWLCPQFGPFVVRGVTFNESLTSDHESFFFPFSLRVLVETSGNTILTLHLTILKILARDANLDFSIVFNSKIIEESNQIPMAWNWTELFLF